MCRHAGAIIPADRSVSAPRSPGDWGSAAIVGSLSPAAVALAAFFVAEKRAASTMRRPTCRSSSLDHRAARHLVRVFGHALGPDVISTVVMSAASSVLVGKLSGADAVRPGLLERPGAPLSSIL